MYKILLTTKGLLSNLQSPYSDIYTRDNKHRNDDIGISYLSKLYHDTCMGKKEMYKILLTTEGLLSNLQSALNT